MNKLVSGLGGTLLALASIAATSHAARAQAPAVPAPLAQQYTQAATPVALTQYSERFGKTPPAVPYQLTASVSAGTSLSGGNTKAYSGTVGGRLTLIKQPHQLSADLLGNWAAADNPSTPDENAQTTAKNIQGRVRYDRFLSKANALFIALQPRRDRFAGLDLRLQTQAGYLRNLYAPADNHRLWAEVGYDGTYDNFTPWLPPGKEAPTNPDGTPVVLPASEFIHSARGFLGYANAITPMATVNLGVELLYDFTDKDNIRVNTLAELTSSLSQRFKLSIQSRVLYDRVPVEGREKTDYLTTAQLVYTYDSLGTPAACPACDCSAEVAKAKASCSAPAPTRSADADALIPAEPGAAPPGDPNAPALPAAARPDAPAEPVNSPAVTPGGAATSAPAPAPAPQR